ncbi:MAG TPA: pantoate--beta-alanine ligase [Acidimicrobiales bacterium]|nr:pantoate--beta-alanine ligase [Acidimicrobiales bacterium]
MRLVGDVEEWRSFADAQRRSKRRVGLVPTMGALHAGHASLIDAARRHGDVVIVTSFVNPRQFGDPGDLATYPRPRDADRALAEAHGVDCLVEPTLEAMWPDYPDPTPTTISVRGLSDVLEGASRPGHFDGVASVVAKLLVVTGPCRVYFGEKDFQQLAVIRQMVRDLSLDVEVVGCPIVRDDDGLAFSSRNVRLSGDARRRALALSRAIARVGEAPDSASALRRTLRATLAEGGIDVEYADVVDPATFASSSDADVGEARALVAAVVSGVRLIDNGPVLLKGDQ